MCPVDVWCGLVDQLALRGVGVYWTGDDALFTSLQRTHAIHYVSHWSVCQLLYNMGFRADALANSLSFANSYAVFGLLWRLRSR